MESENAAIRINGIPMSVLSRVSVLTLPLLLLLILPAVVEAQFTGPGPFSYTDNYGTWTYATNQGAVTITAYTGPGGEVTVPSTIDGLPVSFIDGQVELPNGWSGAFEWCASLTSVTIPSSVIYLGEYAFADCTTLTSAYFEGSVPECDYHGVFSYWGLSETEVLDPATMYYLPGTTGWSTNISLPTVEPGGGFSVTFPTELWTPQVQTTDSSFGVRTNQFGFTINWASGMTVDVDACTDLANPTWIPLATNTLTTGSLYFSDPNWTNYPSRFYRLRMP
jgi:hypothetical protein